MLPRVLSRAGAQTTGANMAFKFGVVNSEPVKQAEICKFVPMDQILNLRQIILKVHLFEYGLASPTLKLIGS